jgi:hypothetical protein
VAEDETPNETETPFTEEVKKRRKRVLPAPPVWNIGRTIGQLKRRNPELVDTLNEYAKASGMSPTQVMEAALDYFLVKRRIAQSSLTVDQIYEAWMLLNEMQRNAIELWTSWAGIMFSEQYRSMLELRSELTPPPAPVGPPPEKLKRFEEKILDRFEPLLEHVIEWSMQSFFKAMAPYGMKPPPNMQKKIPVTISYETEEASG